MKLQRSFWIHALVIALTAGALLWSPLWNGYPFIHSDTGTYLNSAFNFGVPLDRPIGYSLFLRAVSLTPSLWSVVIVQACITAYLMLRVGELFLPRSGKRVWFAFAIALLTILFSTLSLFVGYILADLLAAWLWLATILFLITPQRAERIFAAWVLMMSVWAHNSHVALALGIVVCAALVAILVRGAFAKRVVGYAGVIGFALASMMLLNVYLFAPLTPTRGGDTILLSRFHEFGVLRETLEKNCAREHWALCDSLDLVRAHDREWRWLLHGANSPVMQIGFDKHAGEQRAIVLDALRCCAPTILLESARESWRQYWLMAMFDYIKPGPADKVSLTAVRELYPREWATYLATAQQRGELARVWLLPVAEETMLAFWTVALLGLTIFAWWRAQRARAALLLSTLAFVAWNAVVMATFSGAVTRYQARVAWLIPFVVLIAASAFVFSRKVEE